MFFAFSTCSSGYNKLKLKNLPSTKLQSHEAGNATSSEAFMDPREGFFRPNKRRLNQSSMRSIDGELVGSSIRSPSPKSQMVRWKMMEVYTLWGDSPMTRPSVHKEKLEKPRKTKPNRTHLVTWIVKPKPSRFLFPPFLLSKLW